MPWSRRSARERHALAVGIARELNEASEPDRVARRLLAAVQTRIGAPVAALLWAWRPDQPLAAAAVRGDGLARIAGIEVPADGGLARALAGLGRPASVTELERIEEARDALRPFVAARFGLLVPVRDAAGLIALITAEERAGGGGWTHADFEALSGITEAAAVPIAAALGACAQMDDLVEAMAERVPRAGAAMFHAEAIALARHAARELALEPRLQVLVGHAIALHEWTRGADGAEMLERLAGFDRSGTVTRLSDLMAGADAPPVDGAPAPEEARAAGLVAAGLRYAGSRARGASIADACAGAIAARDGRLDARARAALERAVTRDAEDAA